MIADEIDPAQPLGAVPARLSADRLPALDAPELDGLRLKDLLR
jgi:hypothetical protein